MRGHAVATFLFVTLVTACVAPTESPILTIQPAASSSLEASPRAQPQTFATQSYPTPVSTPTATTDGDWQVGTTEFEFMPSGLIANQRGYVAYGITYRPPNTLATSLPEQSAPPYLGSISSGVAFSSDGLDWQRVPVIADDSAVLAVRGAASPDRFVLVGVGTLGGGAYVSRDGSSWDFHMLSADSQGGPDHIAGSESGFLALESPAAASDASTTAWFSQDGDSWRSVNAPDVDEIVAVSARGPGFVAIGITSDPVVSDQFTYSVWETIDGSTWTMDEFPHDDCCRPYDVVANDTEAVVVGAGDCSGGTIGVGWTARAGATAWQRAGHSASLNNGYLQTVAPYETGFLAVGTHGANFASSTVGVWTSDGGMAWDLRRDLTLPGGWLSEGPVTGPTGILVLTQDLEAPGAATQTLSSSNGPPVETWLLRPRGSPGEPRETGPTYSDGCDVPSTGLGFSFGAFERYFATNVAPTDDAVTFKDKTIDGKPAREGMDADATIDILISGDPTNASRIEVFGRDRQARPGAAFVALQWMFARNADLGDVYQVVDGSLTHAEITNADVKVTVDRLTASDWQYKFVVMPAYLATARQIGARD